MNDMQMTQAECAQTADKLVSWFKSQDISAAEAVPIMCMVMGCSVKVLFKDTHGQNKAIAAITQMLHDFKGG